MYTLSLTPAIKDTSGHPLSAFTSSFTTVPAPTITSFNPVSGTPGTAVTITGANFDPVASKNEVTFNGALATVTAASTTSLTATVPSGATTGPIAVTTRGGTATSATNFTVITTPPPTITSFSPISGRVGDSVTILGTNFDPTLAGNTVKFGMVFASIVSASSTQLVVTVPLNATTAALSVTTAGGTATSTGNFVPIVLTSVSVAPGLLTLPTGLSAPLHATAVFSDGTSRDVSSLAGWSSSNSNAASVTAAGIAQGVAPGSTTLSAAFGGLTATVQAQVIQSQPGDPPLPPDPSTVAPPLNRTVATTMSDATAFLYSGTTPIQTGVAPGTIQSLRVAVLRGTVRTRDGFPLPAVTITVLGHPEFGQTVTRPDGRFDLAVNGGGPLTLRYTKSGFLDAQRQVSTVWQGNAFAPDVVLIPVDPLVTAVDLTVPTGQVARGSVVSDTDGARQATVLFPPGTTAVMNVPGGGTQPLTTLHVRATEYTVGPTGPQAMPAELPPTSGYTYAVGLTVDEAVAGGVKVAGKDVVFNQPVFFYLDNFLGFPTGTAVPTGYYDGDHARWVASPNGRVVKLLAVTGGLAEVDTDGDGAADNTGLGQAERAQLAGLYPPGTSLWRVPLPHFSVWDHNFPFRFPFDAIAADLPGTLVPTTLQDKDQSCQSRSVIRCQEQALGESVALTGTPFRLHYQSERVPGRRDAYQLTIPLSGASLPASLRRIELEVVLAGRLFTQTFPPTPNQTTTFTWDGRDAFGRSVQGRQPVQIRVGYVYGVIYSDPGPGEQSFLAYAATGAAISTNAARFERTLWKESTASLGVWDTLATGLGGWSLSGHHAYDPVGRTLVLGHGAQRTTEGLGQTLRTTAGNGLAGFSGDGGLATGTPLLFPLGLAVAPDGTVYFVDNGSNRVRRVGLDGLLTTVAGTGNTLYNGDGLPATAANLTGPEGVALGADGSLYITEGGSQPRVRRVGLDGLISTVAGTGTVGFSGDGGPATSAQFGQLRGLAVGSDGSLYVADSGNGRIRRIGPEGLVSSIAQLGTIRDVALGPDGSVYAAVLSDHRVWQVRPDGTVRIVAGTGLPGFNGDGGPAAAAQLSSPFGLTVGPEGSLYIGERDNQRLRRVRPDGTMTTVAGDGNAGFAGDGGPAPAGRFNGPAAVTVAPDGALLVADNANQRLRRIAPVLPGLALSELAIPAEDGSEVYVFSEAGRHLRTLDALTWAVRVTFSYDAAGRLTTITDADGQVTTIQHDGSGTPTTLVAPGGQGTTLTVHADGRLASVTNPAGETVAFTYANEGLLATLTDARANVHRYEYDAGGRLTKDQDAATGFFALGRTTSATGETATLTSSLGRTTTYQVQRLLAGGTQKVDTDPSGLVTTTLIKPDGTRTITAPDGTITTPVDGPDPRFGMLAPLLQSLTVQTPGGLTSTLSTTRSVTLTNPSDPLSLATQTDALVMNGRTYTSTYTQATRLLSTTTPAGRTSQVTLDANGRVSQEQVAGLEAVSYTYDAVGRLATITQGSGVDARTSTLSYNAKNELVSITDPLGRSVGFAYDLAGRITTQTLPDTRTIGYNYDANGNVTSITPPGRPAHTFAYTPVDLEQSYNPPDIGLPTDTTQYTYNLDRQLTLVTRPDGQTLQLGYEPTGGRLSTLTLPGSQTIAYAYHPTTGNLSTITAPGSTLSYAYDGSLLTTTTWTGTVAGSVSRTYDNNFRITSQSVNGGNTISFGYDNDSLLTSAGSLLITRHPSHGLITGTTLDTITDTRSYSTFGELSSYTANVSGSPALSVTYTRDKLGRITQKVETLSGVTDTFDYAYDLAGRLKEVKKNGTVTATYNYDTNGNRLSLVTPTGTTTGTYDAQDRLTQYGTTTYAYTPNGELTSSTVGGQTTTYTYDVLGNLRSVVGPTGFTVEYVIDGRNRQIGKKLNGTFVQMFLYQSRLNPVAELDGSGAVVARFVYGTRTNVPDYMIKEGITYRIISDHLGSPRLVINTGNGATVQRVDYDEFGNITQDTNPGFQPFGFAGGFYDQHTGLVRFGTRDYDSQVGRWTTKDLIGFRGRDSNLYEYVFNDPINHIDPKGRQFPLAATIGGGLLGDVAAGGGAIGGAAAASSTLVTISGVGLALGAGVLVGTVINYYVEDYIQNALDYVFQSRAKPGAKPKDCPAGTKPIDQFPDLDKDEVHKIKKGVGAGPRDWVGISPDGDVITGDENGEAVNRGPKDTYLP